MRGLVVCRIALIASAALAVSACSKSGEVEKSPDGAGAATEAAQAGTDGAVQVPAANSAGDCPSPSATGQDIAGVRVGMSEAEAKKALSCSNGSYQITVNTSEFKDYTKKFEESHKFEGSEPLTFQRMQIIADTGLDKVVVTLGGRPGAVRVWGVERNMEFTDSNRPTVDAVRNSLIEKYGQVDYYEREVAIDWGSRRTKIETDKNLPRIVTTADGQRINFKSSNYGRCTETAWFFSRDSSPNPDAKVCGFVMLSKIQPMDGNPQLVKYLGTTVTNLKDASAFYAEDFSTLEAELGAELQRLDQDRDKEAQNAGNRNAPKL